MSARSPSRLSRPFRKRDALIISIPILFLLFVSPFASMLGHVLMQGIYFPGNTHVPSLYECVPGIQGYFLLAPHFLLVSLVLLVARLRRARTAPLCITAIIGSLSANAFFVWYIASATALDHAFAGAGPEALLKYCAIAAPPILVLTLLMLFVFSHLIEPPPPGHCLSCDYDLRNLPPSSPCPECGRAVEQSSP